MNEGGKRIGDFEVICRLGAGPQGTVYKAICVSDANPAAAFNEIVALKLLSTSCPDESAPDSFARQAAALCALNHRNIVRYRQFFSWQGEWDETGCLVMEYLAGSTLAGKIASSRNGMPWREARNIFIQCIEGLMYAHGAGVIHRNLRPSNVFVTGDGVVKLIGFDTAPSSGGTMTSSEGANGAFDYLAPEFVRGGDFQGDELSDVFSLAVMFCETLTGELPFPKLEGDPRLGFAERWERDTETRVSFNHGIYRALGPACREFVQKGLARKREARYGGLRQLREGFDGIKPRIITASSESYQFDSYLGRGGFGEVFGALSLRDGTAVAVKYLYTDKQPERFLREARVLRKAQHRHIVRFLDFAKVEEVGGAEHFFLVMELLEGMPGAGLRERIRASPGGLDTLETLRMFSRWLDALQCLHDRKIVHRDIKPGNLYAPAGKPEEARIFDMGIVRDISGTVTTGHVPGTLDYMAPEFVVGRGDRGTPQSDIYSMGLSLYEALTGKPAFPRLPKNEKEALIEFVARASGRGVEKPDYACPPFDRAPELAGIVRRSLERDPAARYRSAARMKSEIDAVAVRLGGPEEAARVAAEDVSRSAPATLLRKVLSAAELKRPGRARPKRRAAPDTGIFRDLSSRIPEFKPKPAYGLVRWMLWATVALLILAVGLVAVRRIPVRRARQRTIAAVLASRAPVLSAAHALELRLAIEQAGVWRFRDPRNEEAWMGWKKTLETAARALPSAFSNAFDSLAAKDAKAEATALLEEWERAGDAAATMGLNADQHAELAACMGARIEEMGRRHATTMVENQVPARITLENLAEAEDMARLYVEWLDRLDAGGDGVARSDLKRVADRLSRAGNDYAARVSDAAAMWYANGNREAGDRNTAELKAMGSNAPWLTSLLGAGYRESLARARRASGR